MNKLFFVEDNSGYMLGSLDAEGNFRYLNDSNKFPFPYLGGDLLEEERVQKAKEFLEAVEDDSSWNEGVYEEMMSYCDIIAEIEKEL